MGEGIGEFFFARNYTKAFVDAYKKESKRILDFCKANLDELEIDYETAVKLVHNVNEQCINCLLAELKSFQYDDADIIEQIKIEFDMTEEDAQKLLDNGPKNELYLYPGQTLLFNVSTNQNIQLGMKSPINSAKFKILVDNKELDLNAVESSVDMFYEIEKSNNNEHTISITVTDGMLSVTNLKACNDLNFALNDLTEKDIEQALASIGYVY